MFTEAHYVVIWETVGWREPQLQGPLFRGSCSVSLILPPVHYKWTFYGRPPQHTAWGLHPFVREQRPFPSLDPETTME